MGDPKYRSYYIFAFVRNPFDLMVSLYFYIKKSKEHRWNTVVNTHNFSEFLKWYISRSPQLQLDFITDPSSGKIIVDYVGRLETIQADIDNICRDLGISIGRKIPHKNPSYTREKSGFKEYYSSNNISLLEEYFENDLVKLGYDYNGIVEGVKPIL